jgi:hypothetical protein
MKAVLILCNAVSVLAYLAWLGWHHLKALGSSYGNANPASGPGDVGYVFVVVAVATVACAAGSAFAPAGAARILALAPLAFILLGQGFIAWRQGANRGRLREEQAARASAGEAKLARISRDYVLKADAADRAREFKESILTHDRERKTLVRVDVGFRGELDAYAVGRIGGDVLETLEPPASLEKFYRRYVDAEGKSIFDRYTLKHRPGQDLKAYGLERYDR